MPLWESAFHASMALVLWRLRGVQAFRWQLLKLYLVAYCVFRFGVEFVRVEPRIALGLTPYQYGSVALVALMAILWLRDERAKRSVAASTSPLLSPQR